ncbi:GvpL/GvpF family gas vesicle protein [Actinacidiphila glaucinigra]|uniref:GvpL/GvpF family gas vesicle protein n=1 Tax=Actinacidiphila glaucinigra TaxID=235986 RepID=UPI0033A5801E
MTTALYSYAVLLPFAGQDQALEHLQGVAGRPVHIIYTTGLAAAVSDVPVADFDTEALKRHLEDLPWLEATARAHHRVVEALARHTTVLPLRLATIHRDEERLAALFAQKYQAFAESLATLAGQLEWGVKIYALPARQAPARTVAPGTSPGKAYLLQRRAQRQHAESTEQQALALADRINADLGTLVTASRQHRPQAGQLAEGPGVNVANTAYLVHREKSGAFASLVKQAAAAVPDVRVELTGPWAPYSFIGTGEPS